jgi:hypothetical protein
MSIIASRIFPLPPPSLFSTGSHVPALPMNPLFSRLPYEIALVIAEYTGPSFVRLAQVDKDTNEFLRECNDYYVGGYRTTLTPITTSGSEIMMISMFPELFGKWGRGRTNMCHELTLISAVQNNDMRGVKHAISLGVDLETRVASSNVRSGEVEGTASFPIKIAAGFMNKEIVKGILAYGGDINPMMNCSKRWFLDGYTDLIDYIPAEDKSGLGVMILQEYIRRKDFTPFFNRYWRSERRVFGWYCDALEELDGQTIETGWLSNCSNMECAKFCQSIYMKNGRLFCAECVTEASPPPIEKDRTLLWIPDEDETVDYADGPHWDDGDHEAGGYDEGALDDASIGTFDDEWGAYGDDDVQVFYGDDEL